MNREPSMRGAGMVVALALSGCGHATTADADPEGASPVSASPAWAARFGDEAAQRATGVAVDASGDVIVTGSFLGTVDFGRGALKAPPAGELFVAKLDASGAALWSTAWGATEAHGVAADASGDLFLVGRTGSPPAPTAPAGGFFLGKLDGSGHKVWQTPLESAFDGWNLAVSGGGYPMLSARTEAGLHIEMRDPTGGPCWDITFPVKCTSGMAGIATNAHSTIAITGFYDCPVYLGGAALPASGAHNVFVSTFDSSGDPVWNGGFGSAGSDVKGSAIAMDEAGDTFVAGTYTGSFELGGTKLPSSTNGGFVARFGPTGTIAWSRGFDGAAPLSGAGIVVTPSGRVLVAASSPSGVVLDASTSPVVGPFVLELTTEGAYVGAYAFAPKGAPSSFSVSAVAAGDTAVAFAGTLTGTVDLGAIALTSAGSSDALVGELFRASP